MKIPALNKKLGIAALLALAFGSATPAFATNYYIATNGNDSHDGTTIGNAWATMAHAMSVSAVGAGDTIIVLDGNYKQQFNITKSGNTTSGNLVIKAQNPLGAILDGADINGVKYSKTNGVHVTGDFVKIDGFKVKSHKGAGIFIDASHDVTITNCESFDNKAAGIYSGGSDYLWIDRNEVYDNAWGDNVVTSGISIHLPRNITGDTQTTTPRINIRWNVVHDNWQDATNPTDGAGIILDDLRCRQSDPLPDYEFPAVVEGNLIYLNGGPGLKLFSSRYLTVRNNTAFKNNRHRNATQTWCAEISIINCDDVKVVNNIAAHDSINSHMTAFANLIQGKNNDDPTYDDDNVNIVWKNNLLYGYTGTSAINTNFDGASVPTTGSPDYNKIDVTPGFIDATAPGFNFRLNPGSNSRNAGTQALGYATKDLDNHTRPMGSKIDIGCYEYVE